MIRMSRIIALISFGYENADILLILHSGLFHLALSFALVVSLCITYV